MAKDIESYIYYSQKFPQKKVTGTCWGKFNMCIVIFRTKDSQHFSAFHLLSPNENMVILSRELIVLIISQSDLLCPQLIYTVAPISSQLAIELLHNYAK